MKRSASLRSKGRRLLRRRKPPESRKPLKRLRERAMKPRLLSNRNPPPLSKPMREKRKREQPSTLRRMKSRRMMDLIHLSRRRTPKRRRIRRTERRVVLRKQNDLICVNY